MILKREDFVYDHKDNSCYLALAKGRYIFNNLIYNINTRSTFVLETGISNYDFKFNKNVDSDFSRLFDGK